MIIIGLPLVAAVQRVRGRDGVDRLMQREIREWSIMQRVYKDPMQIEGKKTDMSKRARHTFEAGGSVTYHLSE